MKPVFNLAFGQKICLASSSPRRKTLLGELGIPFTVAISDCEESAPAPGEDPSAYVARIAASKAASVCKQQVGRTIIAADTIVYAAGEILGKPKDLEHALDMLRKLNANCHEVFTGVAIIPTESGNTGLAPGLNFVEVSKVFFDSWPDAVLKAYAGTGEGLDKAGAYAVQGQGAFLISKIIGSWSNVVGLPVSGLIQKLLQHGILTV